MLKGIAIGIGFIFGITIAVIAIVLLSILAMYLYKLFMRRKFSGRIFTKYKEFLIREEKFEELILVNEIIEKLKTNKRPKELLQNYSVSIDIYFFWTPYHEGDRLILRHDKRIIRKKGKKRKKTGGSFSSPPPQL